MKGFLLVVVLSEFGWICSSTFVSPRKKCLNENMVNLLDGLPHTAYSSSSHLDNYASFKAGVTSNNVSSGLAWCPYGEVSVKSNEWIETELRGMNTITTIFTFGMDNGNYGFFVPHFYFDYQRENQSTWIRYRKKDGETILPGNTDPRNSHAKRFDPYVIAKRIRIIPYSSESRRVCLKFSVYGCNFDDGVVEYIIQQGDKFTEKSGQSFYLMDRTYDSTTMKADNLRTPGVLLSGGMGQLMDSVIGSDTLGTIDNSDRNLVGWFRNKTKSVQLIFRFDKIRKIRKVSFHVLNNFNRKISLFSTAKIEFSIGGMIYGAKYPQIYYSERPDRNLMKARWIEISLNDSVARFVKVTLEFDMDWIVLSEVKFTTDVHDYQNVSHEKAATEIIVPKPDKTNSNNDQPNMNFTLLLVGILVIFVVVIAIIGCFTFRIRNQRKHRLKGKTNQSILYGNMTYNNVIPIPVVSNGNNGGFYKPVPTGVYDCMIPYQSQTLNVRKMPNHHAPHNNQLFGTFNNRSNNKNAASLLSNYNSENYTGSLAPIVGQQTFSQAIGPVNVDNRRASYDGSYAGTGSNPDYSTSPAVRDSIVADKPLMPIAMVPLSPTAFNQHHFGVVSGTQQDMLTHQSFVNGFTSSPPTIDYGHSSLARVPHNGYQFPTNPQQFDTSFESWPEELLQIVKKHSSPETVLKSPVGGSMISRESPYETTCSIKDFESNIANLAPQIDVENLEIQEIIGYGYFGKTFKASYKGSLVVVKAIDENCPIQIRKTFLETLSDIMKMSTKNLTKVVGYCKYPNGDFDNLNDAEIPKINYILTEYTKYTDLYTFFNTYSKLNGSFYDSSCRNSSEKSFTSADDDCDDCSEKTLFSKSCLIYIATQISDGMAQLEQEGLVHRDLATRNCLLGPRLNILLTDIAMSNEKFQDDYVSISDVIAGLLNHKTESGKGNQASLTLPLQWMSWEAVLRARYSSSSDVWSFGVVLWEILSECRFKPFYTVPQSSNKFENSDNSMKCLSLVYNNICLSFNSENALLPNNQSLAQILKAAVWTAPLPLPIPSALIGSSSDRAYVSTLTPRFNMNYNSQTTTGSLLCSNRELRDLIGSCWAINPGDRPSFRDISTFLKQKITGFNPDQEYQTIQLGLKSRINPTDSIRR